MPLGRQLAILLDDETGSTGDTTRHGGIAARSLDSSSEQNCPHGGELMTRYRVSAHRGGQARKVVGRGLAYLAMPLTRAAGALHSQRTLTASGDGCSVRWQLPGADASFWVVELPGGATGLTRNLQLHAVLSTAELAPAVVL
jgi:hypothetical protein